MKYKLSTSFRCKAHHPEINSESRLRRSSNKKPTKVFLFSLATLTIIVVGAKPALAINARSESYQLRTGEFNIWSSNKSSSNYRLSDTGGGLALGPNSSTNYQVKSGFEYVHSIIPFTFTISSNAIDFGSLSSGTPSTLTNQITVSNGSAYGFSVYALADHQLENTTASGTYIPDTIGDSGTVTYTTNAAWTSNSVYGFGYTLSNIDQSAATFTSGYKQFADSSQAETAQAVMDAAEVTEASTVQVTYKVNISGNQTAGRYLNRITYTAVSRY